MKKSGVSLLFLAVLIFAMIANDNLQCRQSEGNMKEPSKGEDKIEIDDLEITVIYDNNRSDPRTEPAWGFSCLVAGTFGTILFDTGGEADILLENMDRLDIDVDDIDMIFLSHAHWDHVGGLSGLLDRVSKCDVCLLESFPDDIVEVSGNGGGKVIKIADSQRLCEGCYTTGEMGRDIKEQAMIIRTTRGLVIITGCAHPGIVAIVEKAAEMFEDKILLVMGGFHLHDASEDKLRGIAGQFRKSEVVHAAPCHCSGDEARQIFGEVYGDRFIDIGTGRIITAGDLR